MQQTLCNMQVHGTFKPICTGVGTSWGKSRSLNSQDSSMQCLRDSWHRLIRGLKRTYSIVWVNTHSNVKMASKSMLAEYWIVAKSLSDGIAKYPDHGQTLIQFWSAVIRLHDIRCFNYWTNGMRDVQVDVMSCHKCAFDILLEDGPIQEHTAVKPRMHEHNNHAALMVYQQGN